jgi:hypothetical protein
MESYTPWTKTACLEDCLYLLLLVRQLEELVLLFKILKVHKREKFFGSDFEFFIIL